MTTIALRENLVKSINKIEDKSLLSVLNKIIEENKNSKSSKKKLKKMTVEEFLERNAQSQLEIKQGLVFDADEVFDYLLNRK